jgi:hypothetical protein
LIQGNPGKIKKLEENRIIARRDKVSLWHPREKER